MNKVLAKNTLDILTSKGLEYEVVESSSNTILATDIILAFIDF